MHVPQSGNEKSILPIHYLTALGNGDGSMPSEGRDAVTLSNHQHVWLRRSTSAVNNRDPGDGYPLNVWRGQFGQSAAHAGQHHKE